MTKQLKINIYGIVQGVNVRGKISNMAKQLNLKGYVKNQGDGSVEIVAQGRESALEELLVWFQRFSFPVKITGMNYSWEDLTKEYSQFAVKKDLSFIKDQARSFLNLGKQVLHIKDQKINAPNHVAIIPDGNRRWAREQGWHAWVGHRKGAEAARIKDLFFNCKDMGISYLSLWAFSTENWQRDQKEVDEIFNIFKNLAKAMGNMLQEQQVRFRHYGRKDRLPEDVLKIINKLEADTASFDKLNFQLCLDYNGRDDVVRAIRKMIDDKISSDKIDEEVVSKYLDSADIPDPDLVIRTSGEKRTSGIFAYQAAYAELYFTNIYFPDFDAEQFKLAILDYSARTRRFGGTADKDLKAIQVDKLQDPEASVANFAK